MRCAGQSRACPVPLASSIGVGCLKCACRPHVDSEVTALLLTDQTLLHQTDYLSVPAFLERRSFFDFLDSPSFLSSLPPHKRRHG
jgi:hypothetical protein